VAADVDGELLLKHGLYNAEIGGELEEGHRPGRSLAEDRATQVLEVGLALAARG
jgi:hypothetical protein